MTSNVRASRISARSLSCVIEQIDPQEVPPDEPIAIQVQVQRDDHWRGIARKRPDLLTAATYRSLTGRSKPHRGDQ